ncbi:diguanylate cyclase [Pseudomonas citronellolis]|jgi:diguanylate cyclase (GGDEF)-like protein|uniref:GGDEF domain-containing protein n=1 Tax=Pseudomonas citronellolis TaxID=53408 RepID=UPI003899A4E2
MALLDAPRPNRHSSDGLDRGRFSDFLFIKDPTYLQRKFAEHRAFTCVVLILFCASGLFAWFIDYASDPVAAQRTLWWRLTCVWLLVPAFAVLRIGSYRKAAMMMVACAVIDLLQSIATARLLSTQALGIGGYLYYPLGAALACMGFSMRVNLACIVAVTLLPPLLALAGWIPAFPYTLYAVAIGPAAAFAVVLCCAFAWGYHRRHRLERSLEEASNTDPLTGVANRRHFQAQLRRELAQGDRFGRPCALMMLDIDHFKRINDSHGHPTGDRVICALADLCIHHSRQGDFVARLGGEEFAILMPGADAEDAARLGERLRQSVEQSATLSEAGKEVRWTVSIGAVSVRPKETGGCPDIGEYLVSKADAALYRAKESGRNRVVTLRETLTLSP